MKPLVVTPSIRAFPVAYFDPIIGKADWLIIDDSGGTVSRAELGGVPGVIYASDEFVLDYLGGKRPAAIPSRTPSCKNFGLYYAWREGYQTVILLDDDCDLRVSPNYLEDVPIGKEVQAALVDSRNSWVNPMLCLQKDRQLFSRGFPYEDRGMEQSFMDTTWATSPKFNEGLWVGEPDINGIDKLQMCEMDPVPIIIKVLTGLLPPDQYPWYIKPENNKWAQPPYTAVTGGQLIPVSIMNVQLHRDVIPAFWQPRDYPIRGTDFKIRRHDDVWSAMFLKTAMDLKGDDMTFGQPLVWHRKAGNPIRETINEHPTNLIQIWLARVLDQTSEEMRQSYNPAALMCMSYAEVAMAMATQMRWITYHLRVPPEWGSIIRSYADGISYWANICLDGGNF